MTPAKAISEIKVLQLQGMGGSGRTNADRQPEPHPGSSARPAPVLKTLLEAGAAYPVLREMMQFSQVDTDKLAGQASSLIASLPAELQKIVDKDPTLAAKVARVTEGAAPKAPAVTVRTAEEHAQATAAAPPKFTPPAPPAAPPAARGPRALRRPHDRLYGDSRHDHSC